MKKIHISAIILLSLLLVATISWAFLHYYAEQNTVPKPSKVGEISLGGLQIEQALAQLDHYEQMLLNRKITIGTSASTEDGQQWTAQQLGYRIAFTDIKRAIMQLKKGDLWDRAKHRYYFPESFDITQSFDRQVLNKLIRKQWGWLEANQPVDAVRTITAEDKVVYYTHVDAYRLDILQLQTQVEDWIMIGGEQEFPSNGDDKTIILPVQVLHPKVTLQQLKKEGIDRKLISFTTDFSKSADGRAHNIEITANALNGWKIAPGELFEYSKLVSQIEEKGCFQEAPVILNGQLTPGIGGGICQVSSTLYQAVLRAGLDIVERRNHSIPVPYLPLGQDATYAAGLIDFQFRNSSDKHILIQTTVENRKLTVKLFGSMPENEHFVIESKTVQTLEPELQTQINSTIAYGKSKVIDKGKQGYVVETYRLHMRDDQVVRREKISTDRYPSKPIIIEKGPAPQRNKTPINDSTPQPAPPPSLLEDGVQVSNKPS